MNIAVDIDDTLTDSFEYFMPFVAEFFGEDGIPWINGIFPTVIFRRNGRTGNLISAGNTMTG